MDERDKLIIAHSSLVPLCFLVSGYDFSRVIISFTKRDYFDCSIYLVLGVWLFCQGIGNSKRALKLWREKKDEGNKWF